MSVQQRWKRSQRLLVILLVLVLAVTAALYFWWSLDRLPPTSNEFAALLETESVTVVDEATVAEIEAFCGDCHAVPLPDSFPRYAWHKEVRAGYEFYAKSGRTDLEPPPIYKTVQYYRDRAPEKFVFPSPAESLREPPVTFRVEKLPSDEESPAAAAVSHLKWAKLQVDGKPQLVVSDMRRGTVRVVDLNDTSIPSRVVGRLKHPCHTEVCDLDGNGTLDLLVSDLGSFPPGDHSLGNVTLLSRRSDSELYESIILASGIGRVADARPADFDGDGDLDIIVAVFGMERTGQILLLRNVTPSATGEATDASRLQFEPLTIDPRPGSIHVPPHDFNRDGYVDFVALISQECEQVAIFVNQAGVDATDVPFHLQTLWEGPDLTFGSSGIELVDLDQDGDIDILYTNGDSFDNSFVNPRHGVQWLENLGQMQFAYHRLTDMTGAYAASAGDLDLDGDLDIIAVSWLPSVAQPSNVFDQPRASVIFLEQVAPGQFERHTLEENNSFYATMEMGDFDEDGDLDFAVGYHSMSGGQQLPGWVSVWWNQLRHPESP